MQITFQRMRKNCLRQDHDWNELLEHYVRINNGCSIRKKNDRRDIIEAV